MTCELATLQRLRVMAEAEGAAYFGVDNSSNVGMSGLDVPIVDGSLKWDAGAEFLDPKTASIFVDYNPEKLIGRYLPSISFKTALHSHGLTLSGTPAPPSDSTWAQLRMLKAIFGGSFSTGTTAASTTTQAGTTATSIVVTATHGARWSVGDAIAIRMSSTTNEIECRKITAISTDTLTLDQALSAAPANGSPCYGCVSVYLTENPATSLQFVLEGVDADQKLVIAGCQGSVKLDLPIGGIPMIDFDLKGAYFARLASGAVSAASLTFYSPIAATAMELTVPTVAATTRVQVDQSAHAIEVGAAYEPVRSGKGVNTILRWRRKKGVGSKGSFTTVFEDTTWETKATAKTPLRVHQQIGNQVGSTILISQSTVQLVSYPKEAVHETGIGGQQVMYEARHPTAWTDEKTRSVITLHFF